MESNKTHWVELWVCPNCKSRNIMRVYNPEFEEYDWECQDCGVILAGKAWS